MIYNKQLVEYGITRKDWNKGKETIIDNHKGKIISNNVENTQELIAFEDGGVIIKNKKGY